MRNKREASEVFRYHYNESYKVCLSGLVIRLTDTTESIFPVSVCALLPAAECGWITKSTTNSPILKLIGGKINRIAIYSVVLV